MNIMKSFTLKSLKKNKKRTIVTIIAIIITAAMLTGVATIAVSFRDLLIRQAIVDYGNYHVEYKNVQSNKVEFLKSHELISSGFESLLLGHSDVDLGEKGHSTLQISAYDEEGFKNQPIELVSGKLPETSSQIVLDEGIKELGQYKLGSTITLDIGQRYYDEEAASVVIADSKKKTFEVVGIIKRANYEALHYNDYTSLTLIDEKLAIDFQIRNVSLLFNNPKEAIEKATKIARDVSLPKLGGIYGDYAFSFNRDLLRWLGTPVRQEFSMFTESAALIISILIIIGSFTVIYNSFNISINERKKQFGLLRSIGATKNQIRESIYWEGLILSLIGIPIGVIGGLIGIGITLNIANGLIQDIFNGAPNLNLVIHPIAIISAVAFMVITVFISIIAPARKASKISPVEAIRASTDIVQVKKIKTAKITRKIFGIEGDIALKNLKRNKKRYFATVISLFISIVLFITFSTFMNYTTGVSGAYLDKGNYDISLTFSTDDNQYINQFIEEVKQVDNVDNVSKVQIVNANTLISNQNFSDYYLNNFADWINHKKENNKYIINVMLVSLTKDYYKEYAGVEEDYDNNYNATLVTDHVLQTEKLHTFEMLELEAGQDFNFFFEIDGQRNAATLEINQLIKSPPMGVDTPNIMPVIVMDEEVFQEIREELGIPTSREDYFIKTDEPQVVEEAIKKMHNLSYGNLYIYNQYAHTQNNRKMSLLIAIFVYGFITLITLIGITNIVNTINTNINLRKREFAMLKSIGLTKKGLQKVLNYESFFYGFKALAFGLPASVITSYLLYLSFGFISSFEFIIPIKPLVICTVGVFIIIFTTMIYSTKKLKNESLIEAIREENL